MRSISCIARLLVSALTLRFTAGATAKPRCRRFRGARLADLAAKPPSSRRGTRNYDEACFGDRDRCERTRSCASARVMHSLEGLAVNSSIESLHAIETKAVAIDCIANGEPACDGDDGSGPEGRRGWSLEDTVGFGGGLDLAHHRGGAAS